MFNALGEKAFQPKPQKDRLLICSRIFWISEYQKQVPPNKLKQLFCFLLSTIENLEIELGLKQKLTDTIKGLEESCQTDLFKPYIDETIKQLEVITYYLNSSNPPEKKQTLALQLLEVNVCPEGSFLKLQQIVYTLHSQNNIFSWLADFRLAIIYQFFYTRSIKSVHKFNAILNYAQQAGLNIIDEDCTIQNYLANDIHCIPLCERGKREFDDFFSKHYCFEAIIKSVTARLKNEIKICLFEFQIEHPMLGSVISSGQIPCYEIEKKLNDLPIHQLSRLIKSIDEEDMYFIIKSDPKLKREVVHYLIKEDVLKKQTKEIKIGDDDWKFTIIKGDILGKYGFISKKIKPFFKKIYPLTAFEEKKLYAYLPLESFNINKRFFRLGPNSFYYFYKKKVDFSNCYLIDIDFTKLGANFLFLPPYRLKDAFFIRPKLTYKQLICFYMLKLHTSLHNTYIVDIQRSKDFFKIIAKLSTLSPEDMESFLERHKNILLKNELHKAILEDLTEKKMELQQQLNENLSSLECNNNFISPKKIYISICITNMIIVAGFVFYPILLLGLTLLTITLLLTYIGNLIEKKVEVKQITLETERVKLKKEQDIYIYLENKIIKFKNDQRAHQKKVFTEKNNRPNKTCYANAKPTSINNHLFKYSISSEIYENSDKSLSIKFTV